MRLTDLLDLVLPSGCGGCGTPGPAWCRCCAAGLGAARTLPGPPRTVAAGRYRGPLRQALLEYKERGRRALAAPLAGVLAAAVDQAGLLTSRCWLVPAPSRPGAARARGGDHMLTLAGHLAERLAGPPERTVGYGPALRMRPGGRDSVGLDARARAANLSGRIVTRVGHLPPPGAVAILVDDVVTTGATLRAAAAALSAAGVPVRGAAVLCDATGGTGRLSAAAAARRPDPGAAYTIKTAGQRAGQRGEWANDTGAAAEPAKVWPRCGLLLSRGCCKDVMQVTVRPTH